MNEYIIKFPIYNLYNIPEALRKVSNEIEENPDSCKHIVLCGQQVDGTIWYKAFGVDFNKTQAVGIIEFAKSQIME